MPSRPPVFTRKHSSPTALKAWATTGRKTRQERGYGKAHEVMRQRVLAEEPLCRICLAMDPPRYTATTIADHVTPKAEGGTDERENYQGACSPCHRAKTAEEAARGRRRAGFEAGG